MSECAKARPHGATGRRAEPRPRRRQGWRCGSLVPLLVGLALLLAGCAGESDSGSGLGGTALTARLSFPLQVIVGTTDQVSLTLTPQAGPGSAAATTTATASADATPLRTITLPADPSSFADVGVAADAVGDGNSALAWELTTPYRQSLLGTASTGARVYVPVTFQWRVTGLGAGRSTQRIVLELYYRYPDGSEHDGTVQLTAEPVPMRGIAATLLNTTLPPWRWPIAGVALLLAALAFVRFWWGIVRALAESGRRRREDAWDGPAGLPHWGASLGHGRQGRLPAPQARQLLARRDEDEW